MHLYKKIYEFAASAGAFEGYVYRKPQSEIDTRALSNWVDNLLDAYHQLPADVIAELQSSCDQTVGRATQSLILAFGQDHALVGKLRKIVKGQLPKDPGDFQKTKWFQE